MRDARKQSVYFPSAMLEEILGESELYGVTVSKLLQDAWAISKYWAEWRNPNAKPFRPYGTVLFRDREVKRRK